MKITIDANLLKKSLQEMLPFAKALKDEKDAARTVIFKTEDDLLELYTGDLRYNHYVERKVAAKIIEPGEVGVEIRQALDVLGAVDSEVEIEIEQGQSGSIRTKRTNLPLRGSVDPIFKMDPPSENWVTVDRAENLISAAITADRCRRQDDSLHYDIDGLCLLPTEHGIELVGTDGNHLIAVNTGIPNCVDELTVCQPHLAKALSFFDKKEKVELSVTDSCIWLRQGGRLNVVGRMSGEMFMDYREIIDPNTTELGTMSYDDVTKVVNLVRRRVLEPTPQGLIRLEAKDDHLFIFGKLAKYQYACDIPGAALDTVSCNAEGFARMLSMFDAGIDLEWSSEEEHLYLKQGPKLAIIRLMEDFFPDSR